MKTPAGSSSFSRTGLARRRFLGSALAAAGSTALLTWWPASAAEAPAAGPGASPRKIKLGVVGAGGRGCWIANLFKRHGGYEMWAVADYFQHVADGCGQGLGVDKSRCFSGLNGYRRLMESGVEAVALETPPCFFPEAYFAAPRASTIMARVAMNGCTRNRAVTSPDKPPLRPPMSRQAGTTSQPDQPQ